MIKEIILAGNVIASSAENLVELNGYWENSQHAVSINITNTSGEIIWYTTGFTVGEDVWYNGELYYSEYISAYCADLTPGNTILPTVLYPVPPLGTICMDVIDETLIIGYSVEMRDFGNCLFMTWNSYIPRKCSGNMDMFRKWN